jgi:hypothetical protein
MQIETMHFLKQLRLHLLTLDVVVVTFSAQGVCNHIFFSRMVLKMYPMLL